jgi:shikimate kinase
MVDSPGIILIGPTGIGKTTVAELLAEQLGMPRVALDRHFMGHHSNWDLATLVVYTGWRETAEICNEIIARLGLAREDGGKSHG